MGVHDQVQMCISKNINLYNATIMWWSGKVIIKTYTNLIVDMLGGLTVLTGLGYDWFERNPMLRISEWSMNSPPYVFTWSITSTLMRLEAWWVTTSNRMIVLSATASCSDVAVYIKSFLIAHHVPTVHSSCSSTHHTIVVTQQRTHAWGEIRFMHYSPGEPPSAVHPWGRDTRVCRGQEW